MKKYLSTALFTMFSMSIFAQDIASRLNEIRTTYVRPALIAVAIIVIIWGGIANLGDIRAGGEQAKKAVGSWGFMAMWPLIVIAVVEILGTLLT